MVSSCTKEVLDLAARRDKACWMAIRPGELHRPVVYAQLLTRLNVLAYGADQRSRRPRTRFLRLVGPFFCDIAISLADRILSSVSNSDWIGGTSYYSNLEEGKSYLSSSSLQFRF